MIYITPLIWNILLESNQTILTNFVKVCFLLVSRIINDNALNEAHSQLLFVAYLIEENYGLDAITPNIHLLLHFTDCNCNYGPLYSFWYYSFKRMNRILGKLLIQLLLNY